MHQHLPALPTEGLPLWLASWAGSWVAADEGWMKDTWGKTNRGQGVPVVTCSWVRTSLVQETFGGKEKNWTGCSEGIKRREGLGEQGTPSKKRLQELCRGRGGKFLRCPELSCMVEGTDKGKPRAARQFGEKLDDSEECRAGLQTRKHRLRQAQHHWAVLRRVEARKRCGIAHQGMW